MPKFENELEMQRFFAENLDHIEPGLRLFTESGRRSVEFPCKLVDDGRPASIDILAIDRRGVVVVIETKRRNGLTLGFGQLLGYMSWVRRWLREIGSPSRVKGYLVCQRATPMLRLLVRERPDDGITVYEYHVGLEIKEGEGAFHAKGKRTPRSPSKNADA